MVEPFFRVIVELGYDRSIPPWQPTPARLIPTLDPAKVTVDLVNAIGEGINNVAAIIGLPPLLSIPAARPEITTADVSGQTAMRQQATQTDEMTTRQQATDTDPTAMRQQATGTDETTMQHEATDSDQTTTGQQRIDIDETAMRQRATQTDEMTTRQQARRQQGSKTDEMTTRQQATRQQGSQTDEMTTRQHGSGTDQTTRQQGSGTDQRTTPTVSTSEPWKRAGRHETSRDVVRGSLGEYGPQMRGRQHSGDTDAPTTQTPAAEDDPTTMGTLSPRSSAVGSSPTASRLAATPRVPKQPSAD